MYQPQQVRSFYNQYGEKEWQRLDGSASQRLVYHLHCHFMAPHIGPGKVVADVGCGAGRFSVEIARRGSRLSLADLSSEQVRLARERLQIQGLAGQLDQALVADVCDLTPLPTNGFDTVVCYGGVLNYLFADLERGMAELVRILRPGGVLLLSVNSRWGVIRYALSNEKLDPKDFFGRPDHWHIFGVADRGDLPAMAEVSQPPRHFFTGQEVREMLTRHRVQQIRMGSAPAFSAGLANRLTATEENETAWQTVLALEERAYTLPGLVDSGEFVLGAGILAAE